MTDYLQEAEDAKQSFVEEGRTVVLRNYRKSGPNYAPLSTAIDSDPIYVLQTKSKKYEFDQDLITATSKVLLFPHDCGITKSMKVIDGSELSITSIEELKPANQVIFYRVIIDG